VGEPQKSNFFQRALDTVFGVQPKASPVRRKVFKGEKSGKTIVTTETRSPYYKGIPGAKKAPPSPATGGFLSKAQIKHRNRINLYDTYGRKSVDRELKRGEGLITGKGPRAGGGRGPSGFFDYPTDPEGNIMGPAQSYATPATHVKQELDYPQRMKKKFTDLVDMGMRSMGTFDSWFKKQDPHWHKSGQAKSHPLTEYKGPQESLAPPPLTDNEIRFLTREYEYQQKRSLVPLPPFVQWVESQR
jgi:hypothetical protein